MTDDPDIQRRMAIRQIATTTAAVAIGLALVTSQAPLSLQLLGVALGLFGLAHCLFTLSISLVPPLKEFLFLARLPMFLSSILLVLHLARSY